MRELISSRRKAIATAALLLLSGTGLIFVLNPQRSLLVAIHDSPVRLEPEYYYAGFNISEYQTIDFLLMLSVSFGGNRTNLPVLFWKLYAVGLHEFERSHAENLTEEITSGQFWGFHEGVVSVGGVHMPCSPFETRITSQYSGPQPELAGEYVICVWFGDGHGVSDDSASVDISVTLHHGRWF